MPSRCTARVRRIRVPAALAALAVAALFAAPEYAAAQDSDTWSIAILSSAPDQVSGGDALVRVGFPGSVIKENARLFLNGVDVTSSLAPQGGSLVGVVEGFVSVVDFRVAGWNVTTTTATSYEHGTSGDLADGALVKVKGVANADGVLVAQKIAFRAVSDIRIVAQLDSKSPAGGLELLGVDVTVSGTTVFQDMSALALREFDFADLAVGNWLDVRGYEEPAGSGAVVATHVVRIDPASSVRMRGPFRDPARPSFDVLSVLVTTSDATRFVLEGNIRITAEEFFAQAPGELVEAWGTWSAPVLGAQRVEIKTSDVD